MTTLSYSEARNDLAELWGKIESERKPVKLVRRGHKSLAILPASELNSMMLLLQNYRSRLNELETDKAIKEVASGGNKYDSVDQMMRSVLSR